VAAGAVLLAFCFFLLLLVPVVLFLFTYIFRQACAWSGLPKPNILTAAGVMILIRISTTISEALMRFVVFEACDRAGYPDWEADIIVLFLFLPIDMLISAGLHSGLMNIKFGKGIEVWFVQGLIILTMLAAITFVVALYLLVKHFN
jgi:hypothetical protein